MRVGRVPLRRRFSSMTAAGRCAKAVPRATHSSVALVTALQVFRIPHEQRSKPLGSAPEKRSTFNFQVVRLVGTLAKKIVHLRMT
jgi:hypothetical protein